MYGSVINRIMDMNDPQQVEVGMKATVLGYSDRHPATVVEVERHPKTGKVVAVVIQELEWVQEPFPSGYAKEITNTPKGSPDRYLVATRGKKKGQIPNLMFGVHDAYYDHSM